MAVIAFLKYAKHYFLISCNVQLNHFLGLRITLTLQLILIKQLVEPIKLNGNIKESNLILSASFFFYICLLCVFLQFYVLKITVMLVDFNAYFFSLNLKLLAC
jgi:hypothetical protein